MHDMTIPFDSSIPGFLFKTAATKEWAEEKILKRNVYALWQNKHPPTNDHLLAAQQEPYKKRISQTRENHNNTTKTNKPN